VFKGGGGRTPRPTEPHTNGFRVNYIIIIITIIIMRLPPTVEPEPQ
jgi:hypothetical protein